MRRADGTLHRLAPMPQETDHHLLSRLRRTLLERVAADAPPLGSLGLYHARAPQTLRAVPIHAPCAGLVLAGRKELEVGGRRLVITPGELMLLPPGSNLYLANHPGEGGVYLTLLTVFSGEVIDQFRRLYGPATAAWSQPPLWRAAAPPAVVRAFAQLLELCEGGAMGPALAAHRALELLLLLAEAGLAGQLLGGAGSWRQRVAGLLAADPARPWAAEEISRRLALSESSLRRHLRAEGTGFRELLEEVRLVAGLSLLQETFWPIHRVAEAVGYESQSRFGERFKRRFGVTPTLLRRTRLAAGGEKRAVHGEGRGAG